MPDAATLDHLTRPEIIGLWLQAAFTLAILSFLWSDNPVYKFAEHVFVGISAGYGVVLVWHQAVLPLLLYKMLPHLSGGAETEANYWVLVPGVFGLMMLSRFLPRYDWVSRWPIAFVVGVTAGASIPATVQANLLEQLHGTVTPLTALHDLVSKGAVTGAGVLAAVNALLLVVGVICTLSYFYFSHEHRSALGWSSKAGIWFLMVAFGAGFGNTVMARISLLIGRVQFLLYEWWPVARTGLLRLFGHG